MPPANQLYAVVVTLGFSGIFEEMITLIEGLPYSPINISDGRGGHVALSSLVLSVTPPTITISVISPSRPPPSPPPLPPSPLVGMLSQAAPSPMGLVIGVIGGICGFVIAVGTYWYVRRKKRQKRDADTAEKYAKYAVDGASEAATIAQEDAEQQRERERRAKEAREAAHVKLMTKLVVEWSSLKLLYEVDKGNIGAIWEASLDMAAGEGKVIAESLLSKGKDPLAAKVDGSGDAGATKDGEPEASARGGAPASDRMRSMMQPWGSPRARLHPTTPPLGLPEPLPPPAGEFARFVRPVDAHADGLIARVLSEELVARQSHAALVEMTLALHALSPPERSHPNLLPILGIATNNGRRYALLTPKCTTSLQQLLHQAEQTLSLRLSLIAEWNNVACGIADGLKFLHGQRIAHAALHPGNVLLDAQMRPQLADYGPSMCRLRATYARTAAAVAARAPQRGRTHTGDSLSTSSSVSEPLAGSESNLYLSPEILPSVGTAHRWSAARALDLPSDLWALGCLVARLATLKPLYYKERPALIEALSLATVDERAAAARECIAIGAWRPAEQLEGEAFLPLGLLELVEKCTALEPAERPSSALVHSALEQLRDEDGEGASDGLELPVPVHPLARLDHLRVELARDGVTSRAEFRKLFRAAGSTNAEADRIFDQLDKDRSGFLTAAEMKAIGQDPTGKGAQRAASSSGPWSQRPPRSSRALLEGGVGAAEGAGTGTSTCSSSRYAGVAPTRRAGVQVSFRAPETDIESDGTPHNGLSA